MRQDWFSGDVNTNGVRLHYERTGDGGAGRMALPAPSAMGQDSAHAGKGKPPLLMLHGITDSGRTWARVAEALAPDYDVIMLDARGHGLSEETEGGYTAEDQAPDVAGVIRALGLGPVLLMGHSMGGATAVATAAHFPDVVRALILEDPPWGTSGPPATTAADRVVRAGDTFGPSATTAADRVVRAGDTFGPPATTAADRVVRAGDTSGPPATTAADRVVRAGDTFGPSAATPEERAARGAEWRRSILKRKAQPLAEIVAFGTRRLAGWDARDIAAWAEAKQQASPNIANGINGRGIRWQDVVRLVRCPLWVIYGDHDKGAILTAATVEEARALAPQLRAIHVPGAGHEIRRGHYAEFMAAVRTCLREI